jgi:hypothetical protein
MHSTLVQVVCIICKVCIAYEHDVHTPLYCISVKPISAVLPLQKLTFDYVSR